MVYIRVDEDSSSFYFLSSGFLCPRFYLCGDWSGVVQFTEYLIMSVQSMQKCDAVNAGIFVPS